MKNVLNSIKLNERGVYVQASTLGSLEALLEFLKQSKIPVCHIIYLYLCYIIRGVLVFRHQYWPCPQEGCDEGISDVGT